MSTKETKLKIKRRQEGLTQKEIAKTAKVSERRYQDYEAGKSIKGPIQPS